MRITNKKLDRAKSLMLFVKNQTKDGKKYKLYAPWGRELQLAEILQEGTFNMTAPIMKFKTDITDENLDFIENELKKYFNKTE